MKSANVSVSVHCRQFFPSITTEGVADTHIALTTAAYDRQQLVHGEEIRWHCCSSWCMAYSNRTCSCLLRGGVLTVVSDKE